VLAGGKKMQGQFFEPTVIANASADMLRAQEETFGPFAPWKPSTSTWVTFLSKNPPLLKADNPQHPHGVARAFR